MLILFIYISSLAFVLALLLFFIFHIISIVVKVVFVLFITDIIWIVIITILRYSPSRAVVSPSRAVRDIAKYNCRSTRYPLKPSSWTWRGWHEGKVARLKSPKPVRRSVNILWWAKELRSCGCQFVKLVFKEVLMREVFTPVSVSGDTKPQSGNPGLGWRVRGRAPASTSASW